MALVPARTGRRQPRPPRPRRAHDARLDERLRGAIWPFERTQQNYALLASSRNSNVKPLTSRTSPFERVCRPLRRCLLMNVVPASPVATYDPPFLAIAIASFGLNQPCSRTSALSDLPTSEVWASS